MNSKKIILVSHCVLNQNSVVGGWARARGAYPVSGLLIEEGIGIIQLPCPELLFGGLGRPPRSAEEYNTDDYRAFCCELLLPYVRQIREYLKHGYAFLGAVGIQNSPTCAMSIPRGIMADVLFSMLEHENITLPYIEIPEDYREGTSSAELEDTIRKFIRR
jgi:predicted secreted protein